MNQPHDVTEAWGQFILARDYLLKHAPHMLVSQAYGTPPQPQVQETATDILSKDLVELIALKEKMKWVIAQEEERELDLHIRAEDDGAMTVEEVLESLTERLASLEGRVQLLANGQSHLRNQISVINEQLQSKSEAQKDNESAPDLAATLDTAKESARELLAAASKEVEEFAQSAEKLQADLRERIGGLFVSASEAVKPKRSRAKSKPADEKPSE